MIVVDECDAQTVLSLDASSFCDILEPAIFLVMQQNDSAVSSEREIGGTVVVVISCCAPGRVERGIKSRGLCGVFVFSVSEIVIKTESALLAVVCQ